MTALTSKTSENIHELLDYNVIDQAGNEIGTLHSFWADSSSGKLEFIGVKTGWLFGHNHVIPVDRVEFDDTARAIRVPYDAEFIKGAQSIDANAEITDAEEAEIYRYYNVSAGGRTATDTTVNTATTGAAGYAATANTVGTATTANTAAMAGTATDKDNIEVPLTEEQVKVGKRTVDAGQVRLRKIVRTEIVNQPVEIRREDVVVERVAAGDVRTGAATSDFKEETIDVPLSREEVVVAKEAHVTGAVRLHKTAESETQNVSETVRKEDVEVLRDGKTVTEADTTRK